MDKEKLFVSIAIISIIISILFIIDSILFLVASIIYNQAASNYLNYDMVSGDYCMNLADSLAFFAQCYLVSIPFLVVIIVYFIYKYRDKNIVKG
jgi:hypothetical protein